MHNKTRNIKDLNIRSMIYLDAMVNNNFNPSNAALDVDDHPGSVHHQIKRIEETFSFEVFVWGKRKDSHVRIHPLRLTKEGKNLYKSMLWFMRSLMINEGEIKRKYVA